MVEPTQFSLGGELFYIISMNKNASSGRFQLPFPQLVSFQDFWLSSNPINFTQFWLKLPPGVTGVPKPPGATPAAGPGPGETWRMTGSETPTLRCLEHVFPLRIHLWYIQLVVFKPNGNLPQVEVNIKKWNKQQQKSPTWWVQWWIPYLQM